MAGRIQNTRRSRRAAFTLVEVVVLISIVGILATVAGPRFLDNGDMDAVRAHRQALSDLRFAHQLAIGSGCPVQVDFGPTHYTLTRRVGCRTGAFTQSVTDPTTNAPSYQISTPGIAVTSTTDPMIFDALGRTTDAAGQVLQVDLTIGPRALRAVGETGLVHVP